jgi:hypothetical protein
MIALSSSNLNGAEYDGGTLKIAFHGGRIYAYYGVPYSKFIGLIHASSHGEYFHANIRNSYRYTRIR